MAKEHEQLGQTHTQKNKKNINIKIKQIRMNNSDKHTRKKIRKK